MSVNHTTTSSDPQLQSHTQMLCTEHGRGRGKWQSVIFGSVTQSSCIYDFWQCLDSVLPAKGIRDVSLWRDTVVSHKSGAERLLAPKGGGVLWEKYWDGSQFSIIKHISDCPCFCYLYITNKSVNVNADFSPKMTLSFITSHPHHCLTIHRGEKSQLFDLVYSSRLLGLSYFNAKPVPTQ